MATLEATTTTVWCAEQEVSVDVAQPAAAAFARYSGRTPEAYRPTCAPNGWLTTSCWCSRRPGRTSRCTAPRRGAGSCADDRSALVNGVLYRLRILMGVSRHEPGPVRASPQGRANEGHGMDRAELGTFRYCRASTGHTPRWRCCSVSTGCKCRRRRTNIEDLAVQQWASQRW